MDIIAASTTDSKSLEVVPRLVNAVGAGDSSVAGFVAGWKERQDYAHAFKMAVSSGSASAFSELLATKEEILKLYQIM